MTKISKLPPRGVRVSASSRDPATVKGIQHKKCSAKLLRELYHNKRNHLQKPEAWKRREWVSLPACWKLKAETNSQKSEGRTVHGFQGRPSAGKGL